MSGWQGKPFVVRCKAGEVKAYCMCGLSNTGPFCDGSHKMTDQKPDVVKYTEDTRVFVCGCQQSSDRPYCDGTHNKIKD